MLMKEKKGTRTLPARFRLVEQNGRRLWFIPTNNLVHAKKPNISFIFFARHLGPTQTLGSIVRGPPPCTRTRVKVYGASGVLCCRNLER